MSIAPSGSGVLSSGENEEAELLPSGVVAHVESDSELTSMLSQAVEGIGLNWNPPPCPKHSWFVDCFQGAARGSCRSSVFLPRGA